MASVLVINHYSPNKGDRAVLHVVLRELARNGAHTIVVSAYDRGSWRSGPFPEGTDVAFVPWGLHLERARGKTRIAREAQRLKRRFYYRCAFPMARSCLIRPGPKLAVRYMCNHEFWQAVKKAKVVISTGGHRVTTLLTDDAVTPQIFDMAICLLWSKPLVLWSQTIGPLEFHDARNREMVRQILLGTKAVYVRDAASIAELEKLGVVCDVRQTYESVFAMVDVTGEYVNPSAREHRVGVAIYATKKRSAEEQHDYARFISGLADHIVTQGLTVRFFPMGRRNSVGDDRAMIREVLSCVRRRDMCEFDDRDLDTVTHLREVAKCQVFVGHKTHSQIFALTTGTPLLALAYHEKTEDFMRQFGLERYVISDNELRLVSACNLFDELVRNMDEVGEATSLKARWIGSRVRADFQEMLREFGPSLRPANGVTGSRHVASVQ